MRTTAQVPRLFQQAEKSTNKAEMVTSDRSLLRRMGLQNWIRITFGVENIEGSTAMSTTMSDNARATPNSCPGHRGSVGSYWRQEVEERFLRGRRVPSESRKVSRGSPGLRWEEGIPHRGYVGVH